MMRVLREVTVPQDVWLVLAEVGPLEFDADVDDYVVMDAIIMAERTSEAAAEAECARRNGLDDGRSYFVLSGAELAEALP